MSTYETPGPLTYIEFVQQYSAASRTLARGASLDTRTSQEMNGVVNYLRSSYPEHFDVLQQSVELDYGIEE